MNRGDWIAIFIALFGMFCIIGTAFLVLTSHRSTEVNLAQTINYAPAATTFLFGLISVIWFIYYIWPVKKQKELKIK